MATEGVSGVTATEVSVEFPKNLQPERNSGNNNVRQIMIFLIVIVLALSILISSEVAGPTVSCTIAAGANRLSASLSLLP